MSQDAVQSGKTSKVMHYSKGTVICPEGINDNEMYILLKGSAALYKNYGEPGQIQVSVLGEGGFFGEMSLFIEKCTDATLVALSDSIFFIVTRSNVYDFFISEPGVTFSFIKTLCTRLAGGVGQHSANVSEEVMPEPKETVPIVKKPLMDTKAALPDDGNICAIFPKGHKKYTLPEIDVGADMTYEKSYTCPICGKGFKSVSIKASKLVQLKTDSDLRVRYKGVEPLYYDIVTCPGCFFSSLPDMFDTKNASQSKSAVLNELKKYSDEIKLTFGAKRDAETVFTSYYLSILCVQACVPKPELTLGKLWLKLSRVYDDCEDTTMSDYAARNSLEMYMHTYMNDSIPPRQNQQLVYILAFLSARFGDVANARKFYFLAKTDRNGSRAICNLAEDRIEELKQGS